MTTRTATQLAQTPASPMKVNRAMGGGNFVELETVDNNIAAKTSAQLVQASCADVCVYAYTNKNGIRNITLLSNYKS